MSVIKRRTLFVNSEDGNMRFHDWASVVTTAGNMVEPFQTMGLRGALQFDWGDEISMVNDIQGFEHGADQVILGSEHIHGGFNCRDGK